MDFIDEQSARTLLRKKFLKSLNFAIGKDAVFQLHENTEVTGKFKACDYNPLQILVEDLKTPTGKMKESLLRTSDVICFTVDIENET
uniref:Gem-associated protein 7 n=1 Tax=Ciona savignyi TaxID=51511 RepID=H2YQ89_CIOSA